MIKILFSLFLLLPSLAFGQWQEARMTPAFMGGGVVAGGEGDLGHTTAEASHGAFQNVLACQETDNPTASGSVTTISFYGYSTDGDADYQVGLYEYNAGALGNLVGYETFTNPGTFTEGWKEFTLVTTLAIDSAKKYFICIVTNSAFPHLYYGGTCPNDDQYKAGFTWTDGWVNNPDLSTGTDCNSIKAHYTY